MIEYKYDGKYLRQRGVKVAEVDRTTLRDAHGRRVATIDGRVLRDARGNPLGEFDGKTLRNMQGQRLATVSEIAKRMEGARGITMASLWLFFIRSESEDEA